ncbi:MAG: response regulator [Flavobacteriales bacterium]
MPVTPLKIAVVDDHTLFRKGLISLIQSFDPAYEIIIEAGDGAEFLGLLKDDNLPQIAVLDIDMPRMNGFELVQKLRRIYPSIRILVVSMISREESIVRMLRSGIKGYLTKDVAPLELNNAIQTVMSGQFYFTDFISGKLLNMVLHPGGEPEAPLSHPLLSERELQFVKLACSEDTYQEIADKMFLSLKTIEGYRASAFEKLNVKSRAGLVLYGLRTGLVSPEAESST